LLKTAINPMLRVAGRESGDFRVAMHCENALNVDSNQNSPVPLKLLEKAELG